MSLVSASEADPSPNTSLIRHSHLEATARDFAPQTILSGLRDDLSREVHGLFGIPIDVIDMDAVLRKIRVSADTATPFFISTPNLDFLRIARHDFGFRQTLMNSELSSTDGMPLVWLCRLLGIPIRQRITGCDILAELKSAKPNLRQLAVFLFGGSDGVADAAAKKLNESRNGIFCVGALAPGFGSLDELSTDTIINTINASNADFLVVALGAQKGQAWLCKNRSRLNVPIKAHFGAALNFEAGTIERAPKLFRDWGFEWLWRVKEEPHLWRRYWKDLAFLTTLLLTRAIPLAILDRLQSFRGGTTAPLICETHKYDDGFYVQLFGSATVDSIEELTRCFRQAANAGCDVTLDLSGCNGVDTRFFGALLMLRKTLAEQNLCLRLNSLSSKLMRVFRLNGFEFLLTLERRENDAA